MNMSFYSAAVGAYQQNLRMNVQANNIANVNTQGFRAERVAFGQLMNRDVNGIDGVQLPKGTGARVIQATPDHSTRGYIDTGRRFDFAINGDGFFAVQDQDGEIAYTRMGNFSLNDEGFLCLPGYGRVLDPDGQPIYLGTDKITATEQGLIYYDGGGLIGRLGVYAFEDNEQLVHNDMGLFTGEGAQSLENFEVWNGYLERSNTDMVKQMTEMITYQRAFQSAAQISKIYNELMTRSANDVGRMV